MKLKITAVAIVMALGITSVNAQIRQTAKHQHQRIQQGVKSGELTKSEAANLRNDQKDIRTEAKDAKADGNVTRDERVTIKQDQKQESRKIFRKKHNNRERN